MFNFQLNNVLWRSAKMNAYIQNTTYNYVDLKESSGSWGNWAAALSIGCALQTVESTAQERFSSLELQRKEPWGNPLEDRLRGGSVCQIKRGSFYRKEKMKYLAKQSSEVSLTKDENGRKQLKKSSKAEVRTKSESVSLIAMTRRPREVLRVLDSSQGNVDSTAAAKMEMNEEITTRRHQHSFV
ncbi:hypothetical protein CEXT_338271 [Caerostris extrusa]|uniref:Uncharacterized protein n=1 Tax=Caerostris extrusa TaxID=172846 RepID=A0AAV4X2D9_CAEEX|nr:hypothetical protein CEXT_338271 [Caerostris extrusa]